MNYKLVEAGDHDLKLPLLELLAMPSEHFLIVTVAGVVLQDGFKLR
jgi:hypothetical protein